MRPIDADALPVHKTYCVDEAGFGATFYVVDKSNIDNSPTIDAVPVVRCKDCEHYVPPEDGDFLGLCTNGTLCVSAGGEIYPNEDYFCPYGERRSE